MRLSVCTPALVSKPVFTEVHAEPFHVESPNRLLRSSVQSPKLSVPTSRAIVPHSKSLKRAAPTALAAVHAPAPHARHVKPFVAPLETATTA